MREINNIKIIFSFFVKKLLRSSRTKVFFFSSLIPFIVFLLIRFIELINNTSALSGPEFFSKAGMSFFYQLFIQLISLLFGTSIIADETDRKTLIYLISSPISRFSILTGKFLSYLSISFAIFFTGLSLLLIATHTEILFSSIFAEKFILLTLSGFLSIIAYSSLFLLFGTLLKKSTIIGLFFIFGWEYIAIFIQGSAQKLTIIHYIRAITPVRINMGNSPFASLAGTVPTVEAIIVLILFSSVCIYISSLIFKNKEYIMTGNI